METGAANSTVDMLADAGEVLGISLLFIPNERLEAVLNLIGQEPAREPIAAGPLPSVFDEVFVDDALDDEEEQPRAGPK